MIVWQGESCNICTSHRCVLVIRGSPSCKGCQALVLERAPERKGWALPQGPLPIVLPLPALLSACS